MLWDQQPLIAHWNLTQFAGTLLPLLDDDAEKAVEIAREQLAEFTPKFNAAIFEGFRVKLGIAKHGPEVEKFARDTLILMGDSAVDFTVFFDRLTAVVGGSDLQTMPNEILASPKFSEWSKQWQNFDRFPADRMDLMRRTNPTVIARNHRVQEAIDAAVEKGDLTPTKRLCSALREPFKLNDVNKELAIPPLPEERVTKTFCGT